MDINTSTTIQEIIKEVYDEKTGVNPIGVAKVLAFLLAMKIPGATVGVGLKI